MKNINPLGLFDDHFLLETLSKLGDPLLKLNEYIDWSIFEIPLDQTFRNETKDLLNAKIGMMNLTYNICRCTQLKIVVAMG